MTTNHALFTEPEAVALWDRFFDRVFKICRPLSDCHRQEISLELQDHLFQSFKRQSGDNEVERLERAILNIGDPEEFVKPLVADHQLAIARRTMNPRSVFLGLKFDMARGTRAVLKSLFFGLGYLASLTLLLIAIGKPFRPEFIGLFAHSNGGYSMGIFDQAPAGATELLGYWIIPVCLAASVASYWALTRRVGRGRSRSN